MRRYLQGQNGFMLVYVLFLAYFGYLQLQFSQAEMFLAINSLHSPRLDMFFYYITYLGDGLFFVLIIIIAAFFRYSAALLGLIIFLLSGLAAQVLKRFVFEDSLRPFAKLADDFDLHRVPGVEQVMTLSFPSGHTVTAFALAFFLTSLLERRYVGWLMAILAVLVAYSRVYLGQHYMVDVYVGSMIGLGVSMLCVYFLKPKLEGKLSNKSLLNR
jgi:membrane-associated phospholipid phosphatase